MNDAVATCDKWGMRSSLFRTSALRRAASTRPTARPLYSSLLSAFLLLTACDPDPDVTADTDVVDGGVTNTATSGDGGIDTDVDSGTMDADVDSGSEDTGGTDTGVDGGPPDSATDAGTGAERCGDGVDNDGDGLTDCDDPDCDDRPRCRPVDEVCDNDRDDDGDDLVDCAAPDCEEDASCISTEVCNNMRDDDRDGLIDCDDPDCDDRPRCLAAESCDNGRDDDGDGLVDCADPDCEIDASCGTEERCDNARDDDRDGLVDCADPDCARDPRCDAEGELCNNRVDDDGDGLVDCDDPECADRPRCTPAESCNNMRDDDGDGLVDCDDPDCAARARCLPEMECRDGLDDDDDGLVDCADPDCAAICIESCRNGTDDDGDGLADCADPDCEDECATELCANGTDDDGDGLADCADPDCTSVCSSDFEDCDDGRDNDGDGLVDCEDLVDCLSAPECCSGPSCGETSDLLWDDDCRNGRDDDSDGLRDCDDPDCARHCGPDLVPGFTPVTERTNPPNVLPGLTTESFGTTCIPASDLFGSLRGMAHHNSFYREYPVSGRGPLLWSQDTSRDFHCVAHLERFQAPRAGRYLASGFSHFYREVDGCYRAARASSDTTTRVFDAAEGEVVYLGRGYDCSGSDDIAYDETIRRVDATEDCSDRVDNDGDRLADCIDPECATSAACTSRSVVPLPWGPRWICDAFDINDVSTHGVVGVSFDTLARFVAPIDGTYRVRSNIRSGVLVSRGGCSGTTREDTFTGLAGEEYLLRSDCDSDECPYESLTVDIID